MDFLPSTTTTTSSSTAVVVVTSAATRLAVSLAGHVGGRPLLLLVVKALVVRDSLSVVEGLEAVLVDGAKVDKDCKWW